MKKTYILILLSMTIAACSNNQSGYIRDLDVNSSNTYSLEDTEKSKKPLEEIIVFNEEGVSIRREGNNLILSMPEMILFDFNKYDIKDRVKPSLSTLARALKNNKDIRIKIDGYTDFIGSEGYNLELSLKRSKVIKEFLVDRGVKANNISIEGYGEQNPVSSNETAAGRAKNRRVEFIISRG